MSEVKDVRAALEKCGAFIVPEDVVMTGHPDMRRAYMVLQALVSEGLAACDRYESCLRPAIIDSWSKMAIQTNGDQVTLIASILRKARLM